LSLDRRRAIFVAALGAFVDAAIFLEQILQSV